MVHVRSLALDASVRRVGGGRVLIGGSPLKLIRLTEAGAAVIDCIEHGKSLPETTATQALVDRLLDAGVIHPSYTAGQPIAAVTVVIPAYRTSQARLRQIVDECPDAAAVVIVDDASPVPIADIAGATVVRRGVNGGPAAARSTGLAQVFTPFVAFVDTDVEVSSGWLTALLAHFADPRVALVAPRVESATGRSVLARYEVLHSPLDLGRRPARVRAGTRVGYVPSAAVVARVDAVRSIGGFDESLRVGEDVDLVWRLDEAGHRVRYEPGVTVHHEPRPTVRTWLGQRYRYGTSAAPLASAHPGNLAPVRVSGWSAASWLIAVLGWPVIGGGIAVATTALLARKLGDIPDGKREAIRLAGLGHAFAGRSLASAVTRAWWPLAAVAAVVSKRCRRVVLLAAVAPATFDWFTKRPQLNPASYVALRLLDDLAYGTGLASGALRERSLDALTPDLTSWPKPRSPASRDR